MTSPNPKLNAEGWEVTPPVSDKVKLPAMIEIPAGEFLMGTSDENIKLLQLRESDWAYEWSDNELFIAEQPQHSIFLSLSLIHISEPTRLLITSYSVFC